VGRNQGKRPVGAIQVDDVALVVAQRDAHSTNVDRAKIDALVLEQRASEFNLLVSERQAAHF
jgi:hypothetical protein